MRGTKSAFCLPLLLAMLGCQGLPRVRDNPIVVAHPNYDYVWDTTVASIDKYFDIAREDRYDGSILTQPQPAATLFEVWRPDSVTFRDRLEATAQTIRRQGLARLRPVEGGFEISVEVYKELEDLRRPLFSSHNAGSFISSIQPVREEIATSPIRPTAGWISLGRDVDLEAAILEDILRRLDRPDDAER